MFKGGCERMKGVLIYVLLSLVYGVASNTFEYWIQDNPLGVAWGCLIGNTSSFYTLGPAVFSNEENLVLRRPVKKIEDETFVDPVCRTTIRYPLGFEYCLTEGDKNITQIILDIGYLQTMFRYSHSPFCVIGEKEAHCYCNGRICNANILEIYVILDKQYKHKDDEEEYSEVSENFFTDELRRKHALYCLMKNVKEALKLGDVVNPPSSPLPYAGSA